MNKKNKKNMKTGAVITMNGINYGNRLQNYAVCLFLNQCGIEAWNVNIYGLDVYTRDKWKRNLKRILPIPFLKKIWEWIKSDKLERTKKAKFNGFTRRFIQNMDVHVNYERNIKKYMQKHPFDFYFLGSDQIWNPDFAGNDYFFGDFAKPEKRIAFSASIGYENLSEEVLQRYTFYWKEMGYISVREKSAADLIENATGKRPDVILDPTLLLQREDWENIAQKPQCRLPEKYILCLFLGNFPVAVKSQYEEAYGMEMVILNDKTFPDYFVLNPSEFIWLVKNAELVLTDSFHCTVFSIIFHKQFWVFEREDNRVKNMFTRLETLLYRFEMTDRAKKWTAPVCKEQIEEERFLKSNEIRSAERKRVMQIMKEQLEEEKK